MRIAWLVVVSLCASCKTFPPLDVKGLPTTKDHPDAKYVVLLDETVANYVPEGPGGAPQVVITTRWRAKILKPTVLPPMRAWYSRTFTQVESMRGRVVKPDGSEEPIDDSKKSDHSVFENGIMFSDERVVVIPVPPLPVDAVFESEIVVRRLDVKPYVMRETFGDDVPVKVARVVVTTPKAWTLRWLVQSPDGKPFAPKEETEGELKKWTFERTDLPALDMDPQGPPAWAMLPSVALRLEDWTEGGKTQQAFATPEVLSAWLAAQYAEQSKVTPELEATVKEVLATVPNEPEAKARALYEYACRSIQYCAIEIGYGGWIPHDAPTVQKGRYGDCKDKATYLHTLLKIAGVSSAPTLIFSHRGTPMPFQLPSLGANFNHAILAVDLPEGRTVYADPTWRVVPFGQLPPHDQEATVLELRTGNGAPLKTTPASEAARNVERQTVTLTLDGRGDGEGTVQLETWGASALPVKQRLLTGTGKLSDWLVKELWNRSAHVGTAKPTAKGDFVDTAAVEGTLEVRHLLSRGTQGDALFRVSDVFAPWTKTWPEQRKTNVVSMFAETLESTLVLKLPVGAEVRALPADTEVDSPDGSYRLGWKKIDGGLEVKRTFVRKHRVIPVARLPEANAFTSKVLTAEHAAAVLRLPVTTALETSR
jgi:transglutaminase-like putative cysteine protease